MGLSWSGYVLWTNTADVLAAAVLSTHDCRLTMEYVFSLLVTNGYKVVATNESQCGIPWGGGGSKLSRWSPFGSQNYIEPWNRATGDARFVNFCENSLVYAGMSPFRENREMYWCTECWKLPRTPIACWRQCDGKHSGITVLQVKSLFTERVV